MGRLPSNCTKTNGHSEFKVDLLVSMKKQGIKDQNFISFSSAQWAKLDNKVKEQYKKRADEKNEANKKVIEATAELKSQRLKKKREIKKLQRQIRDLKAEVREVELQIEHVVDETE